MKTVIAITGLTLGVCIWWSSKAQKKEHETPKYTVTMSVEEWQSVINSLETIKNYLKVSTLPAKDVTYMSDSVLMPIQTRFVSQINVQIQQQQDSTKKKK